MGGNWFEPVDDEGSNAAPEIERLFYNEQEIEDGNHKLLL